MNRFWLVQLPRVVLRLMFLAGAIDGFAFVLTGFFWPFMKAIELIGLVAVIDDFHAPRYAGLFTAGNP